MERVNVNDLMVKSRKDIKKAKVRVIHKLVRKVRLNKNKLEKQDGNVKIKNVIDKCVLEIDTMKDLSPDKVFKFLLVTQLQLKSLPTKTSTEEICMLKIGEVPLIKSRMEKLRQHTLEFNKLRSHDKSDLPTSIKVASKLSTGDIPKSFNEIKRKKHKKTQRKSNEPSVSKIQTPSTKDEIESPDKDKTIPISNSPTETSMDEPKTELSEIKHLNKSCEDIAESSIDKTTTSNVQVPEDNDIDLNEDDSSTHSTTEENLSTIPKSETVKNVKDDDIQNRLLGLSNQMPMDSNYQNANLMEDKAYNSEEFDDYDDDEYILEEREGGFQVVLPKYYAKLKREEEVAVKTEDKDEKSEIISPSEDADDVSKFFVNIGEGFASDEESEDDIDDKEAEDMEDKKPAQKESFFAGELSESEDDDEEDRCENERKKPVNSLTSSIFVQSLSAPDSTVNIKGKKKNRMSQRKRQKFHLKKNYDSSVRYSKKNRETKNHGNNKESKTTEKPIHPSWEASLKRKQQTQTLPSFKGKKVCFDDSD